MTIWQTLSPSFITQSYSLLILCFHSQATGIWLGKLVEIFSGILIALFVALYFTLRTTLLFMWVLLILVVARVVQLKVFTRYATKHATSRKKTLDNAGKVSHLTSCLNISVGSIWALDFQIAVDSIDNICTVAAFGVEENFFKQYMNSTNKLYRWTTMGIVLMILLTISFSVPLSSGMLSSILWCMESAMVSFRVWSTLCVGLHSAFGPT